MVAYKRRKTDRRES